MLLLCEWGVLWCPDNFLQDVEIFFHSYSPLLAVWWLAAGDVHSEMRAGRDWAPALNAESSKVLLMLLASQGFFCCVPVNVTHLRRGLWWNWEGEIAEIARVRWKTSEKWWARNGEGLIEGGEERNSLFCQARSGRMVSMLCRALWRPRDWGFLFLLGTVRYWEYLEPIPKDHL